MCDYVDEACAVWVETTRKARRQHQCAACRLPILAGATYLDIRSMYDGHWDTTRAHVECVALRRYIAFSVCKQHVFLVESDQTLRESVREHYREAPELLRMYRHAMKAAAGRPVVRLEVP